MLYQTSIDCCLLQGAQALKIAGFIGRALPDLRIPQRFGQAIKHTMLCRVAVAKP
jgi:hypothetical protein